MGKAKFRRKLQKNSLHINLNLKNEEVGPFAGAVYEETSPEGRKVYAASYIESVHLSNILTPKELESFNQMVQKISRKVNSRVPKSYNLVRISNKAGEVVREEEDFS